MVTATLLLEKRLSLSVERRRYVAVLLENRRDQYHRQCTDVKLRSFTEKGVSSI